MADWIRSWSDYERIFWTVSIAVMVRGLISAAWERYTTRLQSQPTPLKMRRGTHVPWGPREKWTAFMNWAVWVWAIWIAIMLICLIYIKWAEGSP